MAFSASSDSSPITVAIERRVDPQRIAEATIWTQAGIDLATRWPGYLGSGWVRAGADSDVWYTLYRFADQATLDAWESSPERDWWLGSGRAFARESRIEKRTGIEGWFDVGPSGLVHSSAAEVSSAPPRWKQAVSIWLGFFPTNLVFTVLLTLAVPAFAEVWLPLRVLITTLVLTPIMTYWVLPGVTRLLQPWLHAKPKRRPRS